MSRFSKLRKLYKRGIVASVVLGVVIFLVGLVLIGHSADSVKSISGAIDYTRSFFGNEGNVGSNRQKILNPNPFNEDCVISINSAAMRFELTAIQSAALKFYDVTGCQPYYIMFNLDNVHVTTQNEALSHVHDYIRTNISDPYAVVFYYVEDKYLGTYNEHGYEDYIYLDPDISFGAKTSELFDADARMLVSELSANYWCYRRFWGDYPSQQEILTKEIAYQLFPESFPTRYNTTSNIDTWNTSVFVNMTEAEHELAIHKSILNWGIMLSILAIIVPIVIILRILHRKIDVQETVTILEADVNKMNTTELNELAGKYED